MTVADDLRAAKALIDTPEKWDRGFPRLTGKSIADACHEVACSDDDRLYQLLGALRRELRGGYTSTMMFGDDRTTTHADIMALFSRAIATAEAHS